MFSTIVGSNKLKWFITMDPKGSEKYTNTIGIFLVYVSSCTLEGMRVSCSLGIQDDNGNSRHNRTFTVDQSKLSKLYELSGRGIGPADFISHEKLFLNAETILPKSELTILIKLNIEMTTNDDEDDNDDNEILTSYEQLFDSGNFSDFTMTTSEGSSIPVHKCIISSRCPHFASMLNSHMRESIENHMNIDDISFKTMRELLRFIYCGKVKELKDNVLNVYVAANKYGIEHLTEKCVKSMIRNLSVANVSLFLMLATVYEETRLKHACIDFIVENYHAVSSTMEWSYFHDTDVMKEICEAGMSKIVLKTSSVPNSHSLICDDIISMRQE